MTSVGIQLNGKIGKPKSLVFLVQTGNERSVAAHGISVAAGDENRELFGDRLERFGTVNRLHTVEKALLESDGHIESRADELRREIETGLYEQNLIPDLRADVLSLVEDLDAILNAYDASGYRFTIEQPVFPSTLHPDVLAIVESVTNSVEQITIAARTFFRDFNSCRDYIHKVRFYESEADRIGTKIKRAIYSSDLPLANKMHVTSFIEMIDNLADMAEDITDKLAIYVIKRDN